MRRGSQKSREREIKRFFSMLKPVPKSECVVFTGHLDNKGYGRFRASEHAKEMGLEESVMVKAHRFTYFLIRGDVPDERGRVFSPELEVDHVCRNTSCGGNAYHYQLLTKEENTRKGNLDRGRSIDSGSSGGNTDLEIELEVEL